MQLDKLLKDYLEARNELNEAFLGFPADFRLKALEDQYNFYKEGIIQAATKLCSILRVIAEAEL